MRSYNYRFVHPVLIHLGPLTVYSYGVLLALGIVCGVKLAQYAAQARGLEWQKLRRVLMLTIFAGFIGARVMGYLTGGPQQHFNLTTGLAFFGVPLFGIPAFIFLARREKLVVSVSGDIAILALALAQSIGRLGCFMAGCCHGIPTSLPWGVNFYSSVVPPALRGVPLHPIQLYSAGAEFLLFMFLYSKFKRGEDSGRLVLIYCIGYGALRFLQEFLRGDELAKNIWYGISINQMLAALCAVIGLAVYVATRRTSGEGREGPLGK